MQTLQLVLTPLDQESRHALDTAETAAHLSLRPQTLRRWASDGSGEIQPLRVAGRLRWPVADIKRVLGVV